MAILLLLFLSAGCGVAATFPVEDGELAAPFQEGTLKQLLASNQEDVREQLGAWKTPIRRQFFFPTAATAPSRFASGWMS